MLVLSRRLNEKVVFPDIQAAVQVVSVKPGVVRLGIEAPADVRILREEVADRVAEWSAEKAAATPGADAKLERFLSQLAEKLKATGVGLGLLNLQLDAGLGQDAKETLARVREELQLLRFGVEGELDRPRPESPAAPHKTKALLVEDDPNERELLAGFLRLAGIEVDTAGDGMDALHYLQTRDQPDLMLLDMGLPRCDGPTTVREIRRDPAYADLKIIAVSGHKPEYFGFDNGPVGIDRWFCKPINPEALVRDLTKDLSPSLCPN